MSGGGSGYPGGSYRDCKKTVIKEKTYIYTQELTKISLREFRELTKDLEGDFDLMLDPSCLTELLLKKLHLKSKS